MTKEVCDSNWTFFRVLVNVALKKVGRKYSQEQLDKDIARIDEFYLGNGWLHRRTAWTKGLLHWFCIPFYGLIYAVAMEDDDKERSDIYKERATEFAKTFIYWFDEDGEALPYGRSLTYRFAQAAFWGACILAGIRPFSLGVMKGILIRNIENWLSKKIYSIQAEFYLSDTIIQIFLWQSIIMHTAHLIGDLKHIYSLCCLMTMNFGLAGY